MREDSPETGRKSVNERRAFTLVEVIVALAIFGLAAVVLGAAYVNVLNAYELAQKSNQSDQDVRFARSLLLAEPDHDKAERGGDFDAGNGRHVQWQAKIEPTLVTDLFQVTFTCQLTDSSGGNLPLVTEVFTVLRPTWAEPVENGKLREGAIDRIRELQGIKK
jgi:general secretion pathway protein I